MRFWILILLLATSGCDAKPTPKPTATQPDLLDYFLTPTRPDGISDKDYVVLLKKRLNGGMSEKEIINAIGSGPDKSDSVDDAAWLQEFNLYSVQDTRIYRYFPFESKDGPAFRLNILTTKTHGHVTYYVRSPN